MKRCPDCGKHKPLSDFPRNRSTASGRATYCKPCNAKRTRNSVKRLYGSGRHYHLKRRYGVGQKEVQEMIERQGGYCIICFDKPAQHVDHDHRTGLGQFGDNIGKLRSAIEYLEANGISEY